jgi:hypothetical protein
MTNALFSRDGQALEPITPGGRTGIVRNKCHRCGGLGGANAWKHTGYTCFRCNGSGFEPAREVRLYTSDELAKLNARAAAKREKAAAAKQAAADAAKAARQEILGTDPLYIYLVANASRHDFLASMLQKIEVNDLSENQRAAIEKWIAADHARTAKVAAAKSAGHLGTIGSRVKIDATVTKATFVSKGYSYSSPDRYAITAVTADGAVIVWFSAFREIGSRMIGAATVVKHDDYNGIPQTVIKNFRASLLEAA